MVGNNVNVIARLPTQKGSCYGSGTGRYLGKTPDADTVPVPKDTKAKETISDRILHAMRLRGLGFNEMDRLLGRSEGYTSRLVSEHRTPRADTVRTIAEKLAVSPYWILEGKGPVEIRAALAYLGDPASLVTIDFSKRKPVEQELLAKLDEHARDGSPLSDAERKQWEQVQDRVNDMLEKDSGDRPDPVYRAMREARTPLEVHEPVTAYGRPRYPHLETTITYHGVDRWSSEAVAAARAMKLDADEDPSPQWWAEQLDRLDAAIRNAKLSIGERLEGDAVRDARGSREPRKTRS